MPVKKTAPRRYKLPGRAIHSLNEFYDEIARMLLFPDHFGRNLDALWDILTADVPGPVNLIWEDSAVSKASMGKDFERITALLKEVEKERDDFHVIFG
jgi:ribonuclease inhibitor